MKINFKKVATIIGSALMVGSTVAMAAAASFPAPFVMGGSANVAVVVGANAALSDAVAATSIGSKLATSLAAQTATGGATTGATVTGGDSVTLSRPSSLLHVGDSLNTVFGKSITSNEMPNLLIDGTYRDSSNNDHDYTQRIDVNQSLQLQEFDESGYNMASQTTPVIGIPVASGSNILNYSLTFTDSVNASQMAFTTLNMMGKQYYVLAASTSQLTLLDSGVSSNLGGSDTTTINVGNVSYAVSVAYIDSSNVKLTVNGETTDTLGKGDTYKLASGAYIGIKDILAQNYAGGLSQVDFSIGSGKLVLNSGSTVQLNKDSVNGVTSTIGLSSGSINKITITWNAGRDTAVTTDGLVFPTFSGVKLSSGSMVYPASDTVTVKNDGNTGVQISLTDTNGPINLDILGLDKTSGNFTTIGKDSSHLLETSNAGGSTPSLNFNANGVNSSAMFVVSWNDSKDSESHVYKVQNFVNSSGVLKVDLVSQDGGKDITLTNGTSSNIGSGNVALTPVINYSANMVNLTANGGSGTVGFDHIFTKEGLMINLPAANIVGNATRSDIFNTTGYGFNDVTTYPIVFGEENKDGTIAGGTAFNVTVGKTGSTGSYQTMVNGVNGAGNGIEQQSSNVYEYTTSGALATTILYDQGPTQETATLTYHGGESYDSILLTSAGATITAGSSTSGSASELGSVTVYDNEAASVSGKNLIVVGGSCINSIAAELLGGAACDAAFTAKTGINAGEAIIKSFDRSGNVALLVAGYTAADTTKAATYLVNNAVNTSVGAALKVTSATEATAITA